MKNYSCNNGWGIISCFFQEEFFMGLNLINFKVCVILHHNPISVNMIFSYVKGYNLLRLFASTSYGSFSRHFSWQYEVSFLSENKTCISVYIYLYHIFNNI